MDLSYLFCNSNLQSAIEIAQKINTLPQNNTEFAPSLDRLCQFVEDVFAEIREGASVSAATMDKLGLLDACILKIEQQSKGRATRAKIKRCHDRIQQARSSQNQLAWAQERAARERDSLATTVIHLPPQMAPGLPSLFLHGVVGLTSLGMLPVFAERVTSMDRDVPPSTLSQDSLSKIQTTVFSVLPESTQTVPEPVPPAPSIPIPTKPLQVPVMAIPDLPDLLKQRESLLVSQQLARQDPASLAEVEIRLSQIDNAIIEAQRVTSLRTFVESSPLTVTNEMLLNSLGDVFGEGSGLEGGSAIEVLLHRRRLVDGKLKALEALKAGENLQLAAERRILKSLQDKLDVAFAIMHTMYESIDQLEKEITKKTHQLQIGESFIFAGGWTGHGIYYQVIRDTEKTVTFRVYNTGQGLKYHPKGVRGTQEVASPYLDRSGVDLKAFLNPVFLKGLQELQTRKPSDNMGPRYLYEALLPQLGGTVQPSNVETKDYLIPQQSGTCSYRSLSQAVSWQFPDRSPMLRHEWEVGLKMLYDYTQQNSAQLYQSEIPRHLLQKSLVAFATSSQSAFDDGVITASELQYGTSIVKSIQQLLNDIKTEVAATREETAVTVVIAPTPDNGFSQIINVAEPQRLEENITLSLPTNYVRIDARSFVLSPQTITQDIQDFEALMRQGTDQGHPLAVKAAALEFIEGLPLPGDSFWEGFDPTQVQALVAQLTALSREYVRSLIEAINNDPGRKSQLRPIEFLAQAKLLSLTDFMFQHFKVSLPAIIPRLFTKNLASIFFEGHPYLHFDHPGWDVQWMALRDYWNSQNTERVPLSFFEVEDYGWNDQYHLDNSGDNSEHAQFTWLVDWFSRSEIRDQIAASEPLRRYLSRPKHLATAALCDSVTVVESDWVWEDIKRARDLVTPLYYHARDLSWLTNALLQHPLVKQTWSNQLPTVSVHGKISGSHSYIKTTLPVMSQLVSSRYYNPDYAEQWLFKNQQSHLREAATPMGRLAPQYIGNYMGSEYRHDRDRQEPNRVVTLPRHFYSNMKEKNPSSLQRVRQSLGFSGIAEQQVLETTTYYLQRPDMLSNVDEQQLLGLLLFEPGMLQAEFDRRPEASPLLIQKIADLIQARYSQAKVRNFETAVYFLQFNQRLKHAVMGLKRPSSIPIDFLDTRQEIEWLRSNPHLNITQKAKLASTLALSYQQTAQLSADDAVALLPAVFLSNLVESSAPRREKLDIRDLLYTLRLDIQTLVQGPDGPRILDAIYQQLMPNQPALTWELDAQSLSRFPFIVGKSGEATMVFNLLEGTFLKEKGAVFLPNTITQDPLYKQLMPAADFTLALAIAPGVFEVRNVYGDLFRIYSRPNIPLTFQRQMFGRWHQIHQPSKTFPNQALVAGHHHWMSIDEPAQLLITRQLDQQVVAQGEIVTQNGESVLTAIHEVTPEGVKTGRTLLNMNISTPFAFFGRFEDVSYVQVWQDTNTKQPKAVNLPRFDLSFTVVEREGKLSLQSDQFADYHVAEKQLVMALDSANHFLLLESAGKPPLVIIARQNLDASTSEGSGLGTVNVPQRPLDGSKQRFMVYEYNMKPKDGYEHVTNIGQLTPSTDEGRLYLGLIALWQKDYETASQLIRGFGLSKTPLKTEEGEVLEWITTLKNKDPDPIAVAIRVQAHAQFAHHFAQLGKLLKLDAKTAMIDYDSYLQNLPLLGSTWLNSDEEVVLIKSLLSHPKMASDNDRTRLMNRYYQLTGESMAQGSKAAGVIASRADFAKYETWARRVSWGDKPEPAAPGILKPDLTRHFQMAYKLARAGREDITTLELADYLSFTYNTTPPKEQLEKLRTYLSLVARAEKQGLKAEEISELYTQTTGDPFPAELDYYARRNLIAQAARFQECELEPSAFIQAFEKITGGVKISMDLAVDERRELLRSALQIIRANPAEDQSTQHEKTSAAVLLEVLDHPEKYPSSSYSSYYSTEEILKRFGLQKSDQPQPLPPIAVGQLPNTPVEERPVDRDIRFQYCLDLQTDNLPPEPDLSLYMRFFDRHPTEVSAPATLAPDPEIANLFHVLSADAMVAAAMTATQAKVDAFWAQPLPPTYEVLDEAQLVNFRQRHLYTAMYALKDQLVAQETQLLALANRRTHSATESAYETLQIIGEQRQPLSIDDLIQLFFRRDVECYRRANPGLEPDDIHQLSQQTMQYLLNAISHKRLKQLEEKIEAHRKTRDPKELRVLTEELVSLLQAQRTYDIGRHPEYLVFEYHTNMFLRPNQVESLDALDINKGRMGNSKGIGAVLEMIMGSGKTAVLLPLMSILVAQEGHLVVAVMPEELIASKLKEIEIPLGKSFGQTIDLLEINRQTDTEVNALEKLLKRLQLDQQQGKLLVMGNSAIQSLFLHYLEVLLEGDQSRLEKFSEILIFLREHGIAVVDEVDAVFDVLRSHHFAIHAPKEIEPVTVNAVFAFYRVLLRATPQLASQFFNRVTDTQPFNDAYEKDSGKKALTEQLALELQKSAWPTADASDLERVNSYLMGTPNMPVEQFPDDVQDMLTVWHEELNQIFASTAVKQLFTHYGPLEVDNATEEPVSPYYKGPTPEPPRVTAAAIPWHLGAAAKRSEFATDLESLNYAIQMYLKMGITPEIIEKEIDRIRALHPSRIKDIPLFKLLVEQRISLEQMTADDIHRVTELVNAMPDPEFCLTLIQRYVVPDIKVYPFQIDSNAQLYSLLFSMVQAFSGTLWNAQTFPEVFGEPILSDTKERTLAVLWTGSPQARISQTLQADSQTGEWRNAIRKIYAQESNTGSFIDVNGLFSGLKNEEVAEAILAENDPQQTKAIAFYNDKGEIMVLANDNGKRTVVPIEQSEYRKKKDQLIAFWDQEHTVGSDIKLGISAKAVVSFGQHITMRDLLQAVWRLRELHRGQSVSFVVPEADRLVITSVLREVFGEASSPLSLKDLFRYAEYQEATKRGDHNFRALRNKVDALFMKGVLAEILANPASARQMVEEQGIAALFSTERLPLPRQRFGKAETALSRDQAVESLLEDVRAKTVNLKIRPSEQALNDLIAKEKLHLPETIRSKAGYGREVETETQQEVNTEVNTERETAREDLYNDNDLMGWEAPTAVWEMPALLQADTYVPMPLDDVQNVSKADQARAMRHPMVSVTEVFESMDEAAAFAEAFDPDILVSLNLWPLFTDSKFTPFGLHQKEFSQILVVQDVAAGTLRFVLIDPKEAKMFEDHLIASRKAGDKSTDVRLALYQFGFGIYQQGANSVDVDKLQADPRFQRLLAQAKFLHGNPQLTELEEKAMRQWARGLGDSASELFAFYQEQIQQFKAESRRDLPDSEFESIFRS